MHSSLDIGVHIVFLGRTFSEQRHTAVFNKPFSVPKTSKHSIIVVVINKLSIQIQS